MEFAQPLPQLYLKKRQRQMVRSLENKSYVFAMEESETKKKQQDYKRKRKNTKNVTLVSVCREELRDDPKRTHSALTGDSLPG